MKIRLYIAAKLEQDNTIIISNEQKKYLTKVMRLKNNAKIYLFNATYGEWEAKVMFNNNQLLAYLEKQIKQPTSINNNLTLIFTPLKQKKRNDIIVEKATELGVSTIQPIVSDFSNRIDIKTDKWLAKCIEAAEQCNRLSIPKILEQQSFDSIIEQYNEKKQLIHLDIRHETPNIFAINKQHNNIKGFIIGPEGGFSPREFVILDNNKNIKPYNLGPNILRAETAIISALSFYAIINSQLC